MNQKIYIDTSVIGGCEDEEFSKWSNRLFDEIRQGSATAVISDLTLQELENAPENVKAVLVSLPNTSIKYAYLSEEAERLALRYIEYGVVTAKHIADAQHIAIATTEMVDVLVSWNFRQIVNLDRIHAFNSVNLRFGYHILEIRTPREVIHEKEI